MNYTKSSKGKLIFEERWKNLFAKFVVLECDNYHKRRGKTSIWIKSTIPVLMDIAPELNVDTVTIWTGSPLEPGLNLLEVVVINVCGVSINAVVLAPLEFAVSVFALLVFPLLVLTTSVFPLPVFTLAVFWLLVFSGSGFSTLELPPPLFPVLVLPLLVFSIPLVVTSLLGGEIGTETVIVPVFEVKMLLALLIEVDESKGGETIESVVNVDELEIFQYLFDDIKDEDWIDETIEEVEIDQIDDKESKETATEDESKREVEEGNSLTDTEFLGLQ